MLLRSLLAVTLCTAVCGTAMAETYKVDPNHTQIRFGYSHFGFSNIVGMFVGVEGELMYDPAAPESATVAVKFPVSSVLTGAADLDSHLKSDDFFNVAEFPEASFTSTSVTSQGENRLTVAGDLQVHGKTLPVTLDVQLNKLGTHMASQSPGIGFDATTTLKRSDLGVGKYAPNVSDEVSIAITLEARVPKS